MANQRLAFIDYFKCIGMVLIVYGHTAAWTSIATVPPVYLKQFGVALFLFAAGYSLARETRSGREVLFNRLFEVYLFGLLAAVLLTVIGWTVDGRYALSNYLPFMFGVNVVRNGFPTNPTTWYIGTYIHLVVLWAIGLRRVRISFPLLALVFIGEIAVRAVLLAYVGAFPAYMALTNWATVFLCGIYTGQRRHDHIGGTPIRWAAVLLVAGVLWPIVISRADLARTFPLMTAPTGGFTANLPVSTAISVLYLGFTVLTFGIVSPLRPLRVVEFVARNTLIIFIAHMPIVFAILRILPDTDPVWRTVLMIVVCLPGLAGVSEAIHANGRVSRLKASLRGRIVEPAPTTQSRPHAATG